MLEPDPFTSALTQAVLIVLVIRTLDVWEREPLPAIVAMGLWGATGAVCIAAPINTAVEGVLSENVAIVWGPAISAPVVEEFAKGIALVAAFLISRWLSKRSPIPEFDGPTDGMVYGAAIGIGFAFAENNWRFLQTSYELGVASGLAELDYREGFLSLNTLSHAVYTGTFGAALGLAFWARSRTVRVGGVTAGFLAAVLMHTVHNGLQSLYVVREVGLDHAAAAFEQRLLPSDVMTAAVTASRDGNAALEVLDYVLSGLFVLALIGFTIYQRRQLRRALARAVAAGTVSTRDAQVALRLSTRAETYARMAKALRWEDLRRCRAQNRRILNQAFADWRAAA